MRTVGSHLQQRQGDRPSGPIKSAAVATRAEVVELVALDAGTAAVAAVDAVTAAESKSGQEKHGGGGE